jgi:hypothetical protein
VGQSEQNGNGAQCACHNDLSGSILSHLSASEDFFQLLQHHTDEDDSF